MDMSTPLSSGQYSFLSKNDENSLDNNNNNNDNNNNNNTILNYSAPKQMAKTYCLVQIQNVCWFTVTVNKRYSTYGE